MRPDYHSRSWPIGPMNEKDFAWLYQALDESMSKTKSFALKMNYDREALDGELWTSVRSMLFSSQLRNNSPIRSIFSHRRKHAEWVFHRHLLQQDRERVLLMFHELKKRHFEENKDEVATVHDLENLILSMQNTIESMKGIVTASEKVRDDIDKLDEFIETI